MTLTKHFNKIVIAGLVALALSGCAQTIGSPNSAPDLRGAITTETLPSGATVQCVNVEGSALAARAAFHGLKLNTLYKFNNVCTKINGDLQSGTEIIGTGGRIIVTGKLNDGAGIVMHVPGVEYSSFPCANGAFDAGLRLREDLTLSQNNDVMVTYGDRTTCQGPVYGPAAPFDKDLVVLIKGAKDTRIATWVDRFDETTTINYVVPASPRY